MKSINFSCAGSKKNVSFEDINNNFIKEPGLAQKINNKLNTEITRRQDRQLNILYGGVLADAVALAATAIAPRLVPPANSETATLIGFGACVLVSASALGLAVRSQVEIGKLRNDIYANYWNSLPSPRRNKLINSFHKK